jgi:hypothetical protein
MVPGPSGESFTALSRCRYRLQMSRRIYPMIKSTMPSPHAVSGMPRILVSLCAVALIFPGGQQL